MRDVQSFINRVGHFTARTQHVVSFRGPDFAKSRPPTAAPCRPNWSRHQCGQKARPKAELLIKANVLSAMRKSEKAGVPRLPLIEQHHDRFHQKFAHAAVPIIGPNRQWTK